MATEITVRVAITAPMDKVWEYFTEPQHVVSWNNASDDWHTPKAQNDLRTGGTFSYRMESKDGNSGFDFNGVYTEVIPQKKIAYTMEGGRKVTVLFEETENQTQITEIFEAETENPIEMQRDGWQAILNNFKKYVEQQ